MMGGTRGGGVRFKVLGPLQVSNLDRVIRIRPGHTHRVLCVLLSRANEYVSVAEWIDAQWPGNPPASARQNTRRAIHWLRQRFDEPGRLPYRSAGYVLQLKPGELDAYEFATLLDQAQAAL